jgi:hypothetical protein
LNTFPNSLYEVIIIGGTDFVYLAFDVAPLEVVWYRNHLRRAGVPFDVRETILPGNTVLRTGMGMCAVRAVAPDIAVHLRAIANAGVCSKT